MLDPADLDFAEAPATFQLRDYQVEAIRCVNEGWKTYSRLLLDMATGTGKTTIFSAIAKQEWEERRSRTLVLENRDALVWQTAKRIAAETGLEVDVEKAKECAGLDAPITVASVPTIQRTSRLTGFPENHFGLVVQDEAHHSIANSFLKVSRYFHYGAQSLEENWEEPADGGLYVPKARILGVTATPELAGKRTLGELYQYVPYTYQLFQAVNDGWLVPPVAILEPIAVDFKGLRTRRTPNGSDYDPTQVAERLVPIIESLAKLIVRVAYDRKTMCFMPSVDTAEMLAAALNRNGLKAIFVSGECLDRDSKTEDFVAHGKGIALCTAALYTEGFDVPDVDAVFPGITKSVSYFKQKIGRATRALKGLLDGLTLASERRDAIANSSKPNFLIIDPFCRLDNDIELVSSYDLYTDKPEVKERMKAMGPPSAEAAQKAERDFVKALEREARKAEHKAARVIDPLEYAVSISDERLRNWKPQAAWESRKPTAPQIAFMQRHHIDVSKVPYMGLAQKLIGTIVARHDMKLATGEQLNFMRQIGLGELAVATLSKADATALIEARIKR